jgi:hypothetical protein
MKSLIAYALTRFGVGFVSLADFAFQACAIDHSDISPLSGINSLAEVLRGVQSDCEVIVK